MEQAYVTISKAKQLTDYSLEYWFRLISENLISCYPPPYNNISIKEQANLIHIPLNALPSFGILKYYKEDLFKNEFLSIDFIGYLSRNGETKYLRMLKSFVQFKESERSCRSSPDIMRRRLQTAEGLQMSLPKLYRERRKLMSTDFTKLIAHPKSYQSKMLCALAEDYVLFQYLQPSKTYQNQILRNLIREADAVGKDICSRCPHNEMAKCRAGFRRMFPELSTCNHMKNGMVVPSNRHPVNRFLQTLPEEIKIYGQKGPLVWDAFYAHKTIRDKSPYVNQAWFGDHHLADVVVIIRTLKDGTKILGRPWITAASDAATDIITGSVVSERPNSGTIAESFCRAAAFTVNSPIHGLPEVFYVDRGKDYKSAVLQGTDPGLRDRLAQSYYLNRAFCENPLLPALNVSIRHSKTYCGRTKVIERIFKTINTHWFKNIPGYCGNCPQNKPFDFEKEKKRLLENDQLWTIEKFARYWFEVVVPEYNRTSFSDSGLPDPSIPTHEELYCKLERANTVTPDWNTLAVFKEPKPRHMVHHDGIHYNGEVFWHPLLRPLITHKGNEKKYVQIYDFDNTFCHSLTVLYQNAFLCEAEPLVHHAIIESNRKALAEHMEDQKSQKRNVSHTVVRIKKTLKKTGLDTSRYKNYDPEAYDPDTETVIYAEAIDVCRDEQESTILSPEANEIARITMEQKRQIQKILIGPDETPLSDYYEAAATALLSQKKEGTINE